PPLGWRSETLFEHSMTGEAPPAPIHREFGVEYVDSEVGRQSTSMPASRWLSDRSNRLGAGAIVSLTAWTMGGATSGLIPEDESIAVIEHHVQLLRPVPVDGERLVCQAR